MNGGGQGLEQEAAVLCHVDDLVQGKGVSQAFFYHEGGVEEKVVGGVYIDFGTALFQPGHNQVPVPGAAVKDQRFVMEVFCL